MDNKLSELSKPVGFVSDRASTQLKEGDPASIRPFFDVQGSKPLYSQEYVSALLAELEAKEAKIVELRDRGINAVTAEERTSTEWQKRAEAAEAKLATPVRLPEGLAQKIKVTGYYEALNEMMDCVRAAGFKCVGDE